MEMSVKKRDSARADGDATHAAPVFSLYGETPASHDDDFVHIEDIAARSQRYDWEIGRHVHHGLCQILVLAAGEVAYRLDEDAGTSAGPCVLVVPPATVHAFRFTPGAVGHVLTFAESRFVHGAPERRALVEATFARAAALSFDSADPAAARLDRLIADIAVEFRQRGAGWATAVEGLTAAAVALTARLLAAGLGEAGRSREAVLFSRFRALLETTYADHRRSRLVRFGARRVGEPARPRRARRRWQIGACGDPGSADARSAPPPRLYRGAGDQDRLRARLCRRRLFLALLPPPRRRHAG